MPSAYTVIRRAPIGTSFILAWILAGSAIRADAQTRVAGLVPPPRATNARVVVQDPVPLPGQPQERIRQPDDPGFTSEEIERIERQLLPDALAVTDPGDRALALDRTARAKLLALKFNECEHALIEAGEAARRIPPGTLQDQRLAGIVTTSLNLATELVQAAINPASVIVVVEDEPRALERPPSDLLDQAATVWRRASDLAMVITNENIKSEAHYRVSRGAARGSADLARRADRMRPPAAAEEETRPAETQRSSGELDETSLRRSAERALRAAEATAMRCPYPIWRDYALADTVYNAATSRQFASGLDIARSIPHPGYRSIAMVSLADAMVLVDHPDTRTTYSEAARAVSSIRVADPRATYAGVLIDSLISAGRFEDARKSVVLLPTVQQKLNALGAVAESMGERELAELANEWIEREAAPADRPFLRRRVNDGLLAALEKSRINQMNRTR